MYSNGFVRISFHNSISLSVSQHILEHRFGSALNQVTVKGFALFSDAQYKIICALGGELEIHARFPEGTIKIT